ncbi:Dyp-type peroxidase [Neptuniibacter sp. CAU 1671]|uniref:Dyp-type peroxidase n=1 Tax=Neptuniibacter sp. CAU 1671 TaxID=3032593 RepID=UPI0023DC15EC|nr:Dyp-type peroxidase [Neptuniibacter sp. CAU 1671]MDF2181579.1 Dyp-type peroxidase [Neptuniibacter sp. CAU 1671]
MSSFQSGVIAEASPAAIFLTFNQSHETSAVHTIRQVLSEVPDLLAEFRNRFPDADLHLVAAVGSCYWDNLYGARPAELVPFPTLENGPLLAPSTPVDLLFHIRSSQPDLNFMLAHTLRTCLGSAVERVEEINCFRFMDARDLTGFVDGTENPQGDDRIDVAVVGDEDGEFAGGSYIHLQRYVHNLALWQQQSLKTQEDTIGRTRDDNIEYASEDKPLTAHTKRTSLKDENGDSIEILRHSLPYGDSEQGGLMFASYCRSPKPFTLMLESMIQGDGEGHTDHLLRYTRAVTGQAFFAPSLALLRLLGESR